MFRTHTSIVNIAKNNLLNINKKMVHNKVTIIGSGPAAHTAGIYLGRAEIKPLVMFEGMMANGIAAGGQLTTTTEIENFPGFPEGMTGSELMDLMKKQNEKFGCEIITETISQVDLSSRPFKIWKEWCEDEEPILSDAIILATGASAKRLNLPGEEKYWQKGISACAVCDGAIPMFRNKPLTVIGGGDSACEEANFLTKYASKVYLIVRKDHLRASTIMQKRVEKNEKIEILYNHNPVEALGDSKFLTHLKVLQNTENKEYELPVNGLFYAIGHKPATDIVKGQVDLDETGYVKTVPGTSKTSVEGVFAAGDVQDSKYRQAITSAGSGCMAALDAEQFLSQFE